MYICIQHAEPKKEVMYIYNYFVILGAEAVAILSNRVTEINVETRFIVDKNTWPPEQVKAFTPLLLIYYQGHRTPEQVKVMAELMYSGDIGRVATVTGDEPGIKRANGDMKYQDALDTCIATRKIQEILTPLEKSDKSSFILIEGAPGIGKSVLLKEIAYRWGKKELLQKCKLVLLICLRDPSVQQIESVDDLLQLFCRGDKRATELASACSEYLFANSGRNLTLLLDGYDEYPEHLRESSLIADILQRQVLPLCGLVVSSRPHVSEHLRQQATMRVDILGFTETEREHYITQAFPDQPHKIEEITQYLHQQPSIDSICFIPFNMVILLYLYKLGVTLPKNSTELYNHFICSTICCHLRKFSIPFTHNIADLNDLPEPYNKIIQQLSKLSLDALNKNKLVFTFDEIKEACPDIVGNPGAINSFGLLQAVEHFGLYGKTTTLNFLHFTIQEFLAAHYVSHLLLREELDVIEENFWSDIHFNMFSMYTSLTKGQQPSFKKFLSGGDDTIAISQEFLEDQLKCFRLYHCFNKADDYTICKTIEQADIFNDKEISLLGTRLASTDMECISLFLASSSNKKWLKLNLLNCYIQDKGLNIFYRGLRHAKEITINQLYLQFNGLTMHSSSLISDFSVRCKVKELWISGNYTIGEDQHLYAMLTDPSNELEKLYMDNTKLSSIAAVAIFTALKCNNKLKVLHVGFNFIGDDACNAIITALEKNSCLVELNMYSNPMSSETILNIAQCLEVVNNTLQLLELPTCPSKVQKNIRSIVNKKRESEGCQVKLKVQFL